MNYKEYLLSKGFKYLENNDLYKVNFGFGNNVTCSRIHANLFEVKINGVTFYSNYVSGFQEFKEIIEKSLINGRRKK